MGYAIWCRRFEPGFLQGFSRHGASRPLPWTFFQFTILSYPGQPSYSLCIETLYKLRQHIWRTFPQIFLCNFHTRCPSTFFHTMVQKVKNDQKLKSRGPALKKKNRHHTFEISSGKKNCLWLTTPKSHDYANTEEWKAFFRPAVIPASRALKLPVEAFGEVCSQAVGNPLFLE